MTRARLVLLSAVSALLFVSSAPGEEAETIDAPERLRFTEDDLPKDEKDPAGESEIEEFARRRGFNYPKVTRRAARGDAKALKQFFELSDDVDGAAAESYRPMPSVVYHLLGDDRFAKFLKTQPLAFRVSIRSAIAGDGAAYLRRHFPETTKTLFCREMVDWPSPDKRYAISKIFSDEFDLNTSKVERAEVIEQKSGQVLCDLTSDDIGTGADREGAVLWSPDSKRFAYESRDLTSYEGNLFSTPRPPPQRKQTAVYQLSGETFARVDLPLSDVPGRERDTELEGAMLGHDFIQPVRWQKPNVLVLERHEYYEKLGPTEIEGMKFESIHSLARWYRITATIAPDGTAALIWKVRKED
ncbi:MAG TPA: hypothetical protein VF551_02020 [Chthoniobacterales bacterium]